MIVQKTSPKECCTYGEVHSRLPEKSARLSGLRSATVPAPARLALCSAAASRQPVAKSNATYGSRRDNQRAGIVAVGAVVFGWCPRWHYCHAVAQPQDQGLVFRMGAARIRSVTDCAVPVPACRRSVLERAARSMLVCLDDRGTTRLGNKNGADPRCRQSNALRGCLGFQGVRKAGRRRPCRCRLELNRSVVESISTCWRLRQ